MGRELRVDGLALKVRGVLGEPSTGTHQRFDMLVSITAFAAATGMDLESWGGNSTTAYVQLAPESPANRSRKNSLSSSHSTEQSRM